MPWVIISKNKKMRNSIIIFIATIFSLQTFGQDTNFEFVLSRQESIQLQNIKETDDGSIFFVGYSNSVGSNHKKAMLIKLNKYGELVDSLSISIPDKSIRFAQVIKDNNDNLILNGLSYDTTTDGINSRVEIFRINNNLDILKSNSILISEGVHAGYSFLNFLDNGNIVISGAVDGQVTSAVARYNVKLSPEFDSLHSYIRDSLGGSMAFDTKQYSDTTYLILTRFGPWTGLVETDTMFVETGEMTGLPYLMDCDCGIKWDSDSSFFLVGVYRNMDDDERHDIGLVRSLDAMDAATYNFNYWGTYDTVDFPAPFNGIDFNNKDTIFAGGTKNFYPYPLNRPSYYSLIQTDSLLNIRWEKFYGGDANYILLSIDATKDGGCLLGGLKHEFTYEDGKTDAHILKVNSQGLITGMLENSTIQIKEALIFPNPGTAFLRVRIAAQYTQSTFELYDMNGNLVKRKEIKGKWGELETDFLPQSTYVYKIHNQEGLFESGKWIKR